MAEDAAKQPSRYRLFIGIEAPEEVKARLSEAQRRLAAVVAQDSVRWVRPEQFHLTLRFLGNVEVERVAALEQALRGACAKFGPLRLRAEGIGFFPRPRSPRVVWAGLQGDVAALSELQRNIETSVGTFSGEPDEGRFHAHLTLGRVKEISRRDVDPLFAKAQEMSKEVFGEWTASEVRLVRSELSPQGARYSALASAKLAA